MKVLRQLAREFWLPLTLGIAWTAYNLVERPSSQWNVRQFLNVLGPTFFFMSWLVAQWYRVRKQQRVEDDLDEIRTSVRSLREPLLPCVVFATLRLKFRDEDMERVFKAQEGFRAYGPDKPLPTPLSKLGIRDGRLMLPFGYLDFRDGIIVGAGGFVLKHPGYNMIEGPVKHTITRMQRDESSERFLDGEPLFVLHLLLEFYFNGRPKSSKMKPSLVLSSGMDSSSVIRASAFDNLVFVDVSIDHLAPTPVGGSARSVGDLKGAFLRASLAFTYFKDISEYPASTWPSLHNFQLWLGGSGGKVLTFTTDQLIGQVVRTNPNPVFATGAESPQIVFEYEMDADTFAAALVTNA